MDKLKYVSPEYQDRLDRLAELLVTPERYQPLGQLALFAVNGNVVQLFPEEPTPPEAA